MTGITTWRKAVAAALTGTVTWGATAQVDGISAAEWWGLAGVLVGAFIVWLVPNEPGTVNIRERLGGLGFREIDVDDGAVSWATVFLGVIAAVVVLWALGEVPR